MPTSLLIWVALVGLILEAPEGVRAESGYLAPPTATTSADGSIALVAQAEDATGRDGLMQPYSPEPKIEIHGFLSQGYFRSSANNVLGQSETGSFAFGEAGINFTHALTDRMSFGLQLFSETMGTRGRFQTRADWFQLDYRFADWFGLRAGKVKLPFGLYNDIADIDAARVPILLPQSVYPVENRNFLLAQSGAEAYGFLDLKSAGTIDYRIYGGTIVLDIEQPASAPFRIRQVSTPYLAGTRVLWETPLDGLRIGPSVQALRLDADLFYPAVTQDVNVNLPALLWVGSAEYSRDDLQLSIEYSRWRVTTTSSRPALFPESRVTSERAYAMATYRMAEWLQVGSYVSRLIPNVSDRRGRDSKGDDLAATLRFDINPYWLVKLEGHAISGTAGLSPDLNAGKPPAALHERWGLFLIKTTAYF